MIKITKLTTMMCFLVVRDVNFVLSYNKIGAIDLKIKTFIDVILYMTVFLIY